MKQNLIKKKLFAFYRLMRIDKPIGVLLLLWPTLWAIWIATSGYPSLQILTIFVAGVWLMRTAGCIINDYIDLKFDIHVKRTLKRPLPNGEVTEMEAIILFIILVLFSFLIVLSLNIRTVIFSIFALMLSLIYPFMKRYIYIPQIVLGIAFSCSIPMVFIATRESLPFNCWLIFLANILWTVIYDTQYAMMDREDDLKIGIKSTAIFFGRYTKLIIGILQISMLVLMIIIGYLNFLRWGFYLAILISGILFVYQQKLMTDYENKKAYFEAFLSNNYIGMILFLGLMIH